MQKAEIRTVQFLKPRKNTAKMLDFVDKAFDQMAFPIQPGVVFAQQLGTLVRRNDGLNTPCQQVVNESLRCIASIGNQPLKAKPFQQCLRLRTIVALSSRQTQPQRVAQSIYRDMDFAAKATMTATQRLFTVFSAPAAQGCARTIVLSIMPFSISASPAQAFNMRSQTPALHQHSKRL